MLHSISPREGDIYKVIRIGEHTFELRFGFYAEFERDTGEPVVLYPDLTRMKRYTLDGQLIVTAIQETCQHYEGPEHKVMDRYCSDCRHFQHPGDEIGICGCKHSNLKSAQGGNQL